MMLVAMSAAAVLLTPCVLVGLWAYRIRDFPYTCESPEIPPDPAVLDDEGGMEGRLPVLGDLTYVKYHWYNINFDECPGEADENDGPPVYRLVGFADLAPGGGEALRRKYPFEPSIGDDLPDIPFTLRRYGPHEPRWLHSPTLNRDAGGAFCRIWLDEANNGVFVVYEP